MLVTTSRNCYYPASFTLVYFRRSEMELCSWGTSPAGPREASLSCNATILDRPRVNFHRRKLSRRLLDNAPSDLSFNIELIRYNRWTTAFFSSISIEARAHVDITNLSWRHAYSEFCHGMNINCLLMNINRLIRTTEAHPDSESMESRRFKTVSLSPLKVRPETPSFYRIAYLSGSPHISWSSDCLGNPDTLFDSSLDTKSDRSLVRSNRCK